MQQAGLSSSARQGAARRRALVATRDVVKFPTALCGGAGCVVLFRISSCETVERGEMLSRTGEYALRAVLLLAGRETDRAMPADAIADELDVPRNYLSKTLNRLVRRGVLRSGRGPRGGFRLACSPEELAVADVVAEFEERGSEWKCLMGGRACDPERPCAAHEQWKTWSRPLSQWMDGTTVADLLGSGGRLGDAQAGEAPGRGGGEESASESRERKR